MLKYIAIPFGWLLLNLYKLTSNYGIAVILFALIVTLILMPFQMKSKKSMMKSSRLQPLQQELQKKHGANQQKYNEELRKLYKEEGINPMSGCLWSLIPFPILIALYEAIRMPLTIMMGVSKDLLEEGGALLTKLTELGFSSNYSTAYIQIAQSQFISEHFDQFKSISDKLMQMDYTFLGLNLGNQPDWKFFLSTDWSNPSVWGVQLGLFLIPVISAVLAFLSMKISQKMNPPAADAAGGGGMKGMIFVMPLISLWIGFAMPAALGIYWIASSFFRIIQDVWLTKKYTREMEAEDAERRERELQREAEREEKRRETERLRAENATVQNKNTSKRKQQIQQRQEKEQKAAEWDLKQNPEKAAKKAEKAEEKRRYSRGRAYDPNRFGNNSAALPDETPESAADAESTECAEPADSGTAEGE